MFRVRAEKKEQEEEKEEKNVEYHKIYVDKFCFMTLNC